MLISECIDFIDYLDLANEQSCYLKQVVEGANIRYELTTKDNTEMRTKDICTIASDILLDAENRAGSLEDKMGVLKKLHTSLIAYENRFLHAVSQHFWVRVLSWFGYKPKCPRLLTHVKNQVQKKLNAPVVLQKHIRGYLVRKSHLSPRLYPQYLAQCEQVTADDRSMLQARGGQTRVYLPEAMPGVVLKQSGREGAIARFHQMQQVRSVLKEQNSSHLIIPKASLCQNFLVEERLPINIDNYHNMATYMMQPQLFDEAVREMTRLFSRIPISDLVSHQINPLAHLPGVNNLVRYDNLPLYIVEENGQKKGKIGLIDLEHTNEPGTGFEDLARIFPYHLDIIKEELEALGIAVFDDSSLHTAAEKGDKFLRQGFYDHLVWLQTKGVSVPSFQSFEISSERIQQLTACVEMELQKLNFGINGLFEEGTYLGTPAIDFFARNPREMASELAPEILTMILENLKTQLEQNQHEELSKLSAKDSVDAALVKLRSPVLHRDALFKGVDSFILSRPNIEGLTRRQANDIAEQLTCVIMKDLAQHGDIFSFDPAHYTSGHNWCWIRY